MFFETPQERGTAEGRKVCKGRGWIVFKQEMRRGRREGVGWMRLDG